MSPRLPLALEQANLVLPETGTIAVLHPRAGADLSALPKDRTVIIQPLRPDYDSLKAAGYTCVAEAETGAATYAATLVCLPRAKAQARALIAQAMQTTSGPVMVDGVKTDGIDSVYKDMRKRVAVGGPISKAHGKLFWCTADADAFTDWSAPAEQKADGFVTAPGVFSADAIDPASELLAASLPDKLGRHIADLGGGWGYLTARILEREYVETVDLVEADHIALSCARQNITDPRVRFHWADATTWAPDARLDAVVMNPPFHVGRAADPALGRAFIAAAARVLAPSGNLWMVANRHLPYEATLAACFTKVTEVAGNTRFKVLHATRPTRARR
jgi:16S rRNA (guanine1207-N2)-methyltransferase